MGDDEVVRQISPGKPGTNWHCESRSSAIVRAGVSGGSDHEHSRMIRPRRAPSQLFRRPIRVMRRRLSLRGVPLPATELSQPGRIAWVLPSSCDSTALLGFNPFAGLLPQPGDARRKRRG